MSLSFTALILSAISLILGAVSVFVTFTKGDRGLARRMARYEQLQSELGNDIAQTMDSLKKFRNRANTRWRRADEKTETPAAPASEAGASNGAQVPAGETVDEWKRRMRLEHLNPMNRR